MAYRVGIRELHVRLAHENYGIMNVFDSKENEKQTSFKITS